MKTLTLKLSLLFAVVSLAGCAAEAVNDPTTSEETSTAQTNGARTLQDNRAPEVNGDVKRSPLEDVPPETTVFPDPPRPWFTAHSESIDPANLDVRGSAR